MQGAPLVFSIWLVIGALLVRIWVLNVLSLKFSMKLFFGSVSRIVIFVSKL